ncbi:3-oxoacyl-ACP reductase [Hyphomicrobiales bacterium]|nr:3-oxoacyl-ACP reductase [Hyphomicrobiales bacterium]CAH1693619.1 3-oxoacyl-ACP reductase [Hyphomicrobiales bacterium]
MTGSTSQDGDKAAAAAIPEGPAGRGRLKDKVALVFGAGSSGPGWGNGKAAAALYAREGAVVVAVDINGDAARETADIIIAEGGRCEAMTADVRQADSVEAAVARTQEIFGRIDVLHNNVGITEMSDLAETTEESWRRVIDINLTGIFLTCRAVIPAMAAQKSGAIINISSLASIQVNQYPYFSYMAAKSGVNQFTRGLAVQYASQGIRANAILPGVMDTPLIYKQIAGNFADREEMLRRRNAASPMGRMGDAWDVAQAAVFLASDEADYITGVCLPVDGGKSCAGR